MGKILKLFFRKLTLISNVNESEISKDKDKLTKDISGFLIVDAVRSCQFDQT